MSGELELETKLGADPIANTTATLLISESAITLDSQDPDGRPAPIRLRSSKAMTIALRDGEAKVFGATTDEPAVIRGPAGDFRLQGTVSVDALALQIEGSISVAMLQPYLRTYVDEMTGSIAINATITGSVAQPRMLATARFRDVKLQPAGQEAVVAHSQWPGRSAQ